MSVAISGPVSKKLADTIAEGLRMKYKEEFQVEKIISHNILDDFCVVDAYSLTNPTIMFRASVKYGDTSVSDEYVAKKFCNMLSDRLAQNLDGLDGLFYIYSETRLDTFNLDKEDITVQEYLERYPMESFNIYLFFVPNRNDKSNLLKYISNIFNNMANIKGMLKIYILDKEETLSTIQEYLDYNSRIYHDFKSIAGMYFKGNVRFENGKIINSDKEIVEMLEK